MQIDDSHLGSGIAQVGGQILPQLFSSWFCEHFIDKIFVEFLLTSFFKTVVKLVILVCSWIVWWKILSLSLNVILISDGIVVVGKINEFSVSFKKLISYIVPLIKLKASWLLLFNERENEHV